MHTKEEKDAAFKAAAQKQGWPVNALAGTSEGNLAEAMFYAGYDLATPPPAPAEAGEAVGAGLLTDIEALFGVEPCECGRQCRECDHDYLPGQKFDWNGSNEEAIDYLAQLLRYILAARLAAPPAAGEAQGAVWMPGIPLLANEDSRAFKVRFANGQEGELHWLQAVTLDCLGDKTYDNTGWHTKKQKLGYNSWFEKWTGSEPRFFQVEAAARLAATPAAADACEGQCGICSCISSPQATQQNG